MDKELEMLQAVAEFLDVPESEVLLVEDGTGEVVMVFDAMYQVVDLPFNITEFKFAIFMIN